MLVSENVICWYNMIMRESLLKKFFRDSFLLTKKNQVCIVTLNIENIITHLYTKPLTESSSKTFHQALQKLKLSTFKHLISNSLKNEFKFKYEKLLLSFFTKQQVSKGKQSHLCKAS